MIFFSIVVPVYNRPDEIRELLASLVEQTHRNFEVIIVEDGSKVDCKAIADFYQSQLSIQYFYTKNQGQGFARNFARFRCDRAEKLSYSYRCLSQRSSQYRSFWWTRCGTSFIYSCTKSHQLRHDSDTSHRRHSRQSQENWGFLSAQKLQFRCFQKCLGKNRRFLQKRYGRRYRMDYPHQ